jgi:hypothetical protein
MEEALYNNNNVNSIISEENSNNDFIMPTSDAIGKVIFATHFISFIKNTVKSSIIAVYKSHNENSAFKSKIIEDVRDLIRDGNIIFETAIKYLNQSWVNYHNNPDDKNRNKIDLMKRHGKFLHASCLFSYIWEFCQILLIYTLGRIDLSELRDSEFLNDSIDVITDGICAYHIDTINNREFLCDEKCEVYEYAENNDFIKTKKK